MSYYFTKAMRDNSLPGACTSCGVHAQHRNSAGQCTECHNRGYYERKAARKAQLAALPRCEFCNRRGSFIAVGSVLLCGQHLREAQHKASAFGIFGLTMDLNSEGV